MLGPTLLFVVIVLTTKAFQAYGEIDLLTNGGPNDSTTVLTYLTYGSQSPIREDAGLKSATAVLLFVMLLVLSAVQLPRLRQEGPLWLTPKQSRRGNASSTLGLFGRYGLLAVDQRRRACSRSTPRWSRP